MMTLKRAEEMVLEAGFEVTIQTSWEDSTAIYAASVKSVPGCLGHPAFEVLYNKETGWLSATGKTPVKV